MRLSKFILDNLELILQAWEDFARTVDTPLATMDAKGLRNHGEFILRTAAHDIAAPQSSQQQIDKSEGHGPVSSEETAAQSHAATRLVAGFTLEQMVSEYRALRSSVLRLWLDQGFIDSAHQVNDIIRFNEAIDQALTESIATYERETEANRKMVLGVLGHDLRTPLGARMMGTDLLGESATLDARDSHLVTQISTSVRRADDIVKDLLDLARYNFGSGLPVQLEPTNLNLVCSEVVRELRTFYPKAQILFKDAAGIEGLFDPTRMSQVFSNLIGNAVRHGDSGHPVHVTLKGDASSVYFSVQNRGEPIDPNTLPVLFDPQARYTRSVPGKHGSTEGLGLGLFIASQIVAGHGGTIEVESTREQGTIFCVTLPTR